jgi:hypothetical protein
VSSVSHETACSCEFPAGYPLNGVQEVAGSNPVAPTSARLAVTMSCGEPSFFGRDHVAGNLAGNPTLFGHFLACPTPIPHVLQGWYDRN